MSKLSKSRPRHVSAAHRDHNTLYRLHSFDSWSNVNKLKVAFTHNIKAFVILVSQEIVLHVMSAHANFACSFSTSFNAFAIALFG